jgi:hypothetical protein
MSIASRNQAIKALLEKAFGPGKVWVRGSRGTAYGWVHVYVDVEVSSASWSKLRNKIEALIKAAGIDVGTYGYNDPGSDYGFGSKINITFNKPWDVAKKDRANELHEV